MKLDIQFPRTMFPVAVVRQLYRDWLSVHGVESVGFSTIKISRAEEQWTFDDLEEFFSEYEKGFTKATLYLSGRALLGGDQASGSAQWELVDLMFEQNSWGANASSKSLDRSRMLQVLSGIREVKDMYKIEYPEPPPVKPRIFIGHGRAGDWERLYRHLRDHHDLDAFAYETEERAGQTIQGFLEEALATTNFAVIVMTGDDETGDGAIRARQNVVHEAGLFQGKLGFANVILACENGIEPLSNLAGI
jgi:hypothetical protein